MNIQQLMDSMYLIPVVLEHLERPTEVTTRILGEYGINTREAQDMRTMLEYHRNIVMADFPQEIFYDKLRKGLRHYFDKYLTEGWMRITEKIPGDARCVLDLGAGDGQVARWWRKMFKDDVVKTLDRENSDINVDFEKQPHWWHEYVDLLDVVILSEVLHCKETVIQRYLLDTCAKILRKGGILIIVEPVDYVMAYRISKIKKDEAKHVLDEWHLAELMPSSFVKHSQIQINRHKFYKYAKV